VLGADEWLKFLPANEAKLDAAWRVDPAVSAKLLTHFYPSTENNDVSKNVFEHQHLDAKVVALDPGKSTALVKLSGSLKMKHTFYNRPDDNVAEADVLGYLKIDTAARRLVAFDLTTTEATYGRGNFGVGVELAR